MLYILNKRTWVRVQKMEVTWWSDALTGLTVWPTTVLNFDRDFLTFFFQPVKAGPEFWTSLAEMGCAKAIWWRITFHNTRTLQWQDRVQRDLSRLVHSSEVITSHLCRFSLRPAGAGSSGCHSSSWQTWRPFQWDPVELPEIQARDSESARPAVDCYSW